MNASKFLNVLSLFWKKTQPDITMIYLIKFACLKITCMQLKYNRNKFQFTKF
jgi:hypothetical protein